MTVSASELIWSFFEISKKQAVLSSFILLLKIGSTSKIDLFSLITSYDFFSSCAPNTSSIVISLFKIKSSEIEFAKIFVIIFSDTIPTKSLSLDTGN